MKTISRYIMTLALLLTAVTGAWAQSSPDVVEFDVPADWQNDNSLVTAGDLPGFKTSTLAEAQAWKGAPKPGNVVLVYAFDGDKVCVVPFKDGTALQGVKTAYTKAVVFASKSQMKFYYTAEITEWPLTPDANKKVWTLAKMPANDIELIPEYYPGMLTLGNAIEGGKLEVVGFLGTTSFTAPNEWYKNSTKLASSHFEGFKSVTEEEAKAWSGVPATGKVALFYNYDETAQKWDFIYFKGGAFDAIYKGEPQQLATIYNLLDANFSVFYTTGMQMPAGFEKDEEGNIYVEPGTKFQVKAVPAEGFHLVSLTDGTNDIKVDADGIATITMPDEYADLTLTATFSNEYNVALNAEGLSDEEAAAWKAATDDKDPAAFPLENVKYGTPVTVTYSGTKKVIGVKAEKKAAAPAAKAATEATAEDKGKLIGADGIIYDDADAATAAGTTAVAKIIYIGTTGHATYSHGLALALTDEGQMAWGAAMTACNTTKNTSTPVTGATWLLASKEQWDYMLGTNGAGSYTALRDGFTSVGGSNLQSGEYWSSTEVDYNGIDQVDSDYARYYYFNYGGIWSYVGKGSGYRVRACLAF